MQRSPLRGWIPLLVAVVAAIAVVGAMMAARATGGDDAQAQAPTPTATPAEPIQQGQAAPGETVTVGGITITNQTPSVLSIQIQGSRMTLMVDENSIITLPTGTTDCVGLSGRTVTCTLAGTQVTVQGAARSAQASPTPGAADPRATATPTPAARGAAPQPTVTPGAAGAQPTATPGAGAARPQPTTPGGAAAQPTPTPAAGPGASPGTPAAPADRGTGTDTRPAADLRGFRFRDVVTATSPQGTVQEIAEGAYLAGDRVQLKITRTADGRTTVLEYIVIGEEVWVRDGGATGAFVKESRPSPRRLQALAFVGRIRANARVQGSLGAGQQVGRERLNGLDVTRYQFSAKDQFAASGFATWGPFGGLPAWGADTSATATLWVATPGHWVVRRVTEFKQGGEGSGYAFTSQWEMTGINAPDITIAAPA
jgi:hypothetical protein